MTPDSPTLAEHACKACLHHARSIFSTLPDDDGLDDVRTVRLHARGTPVYLQGEPSDGYFCVRDGRVRITRTMPDGTVHILGWAGPGDPLGLAEFYGRYDYTCSAEAAEDTVVCHIAPASARALAQRHPVLLEAVAHRLAVELRRTEEEAVKTRRNVRQRVAGLLLEVWREQGAPPQFTVRRQEMAQRVGTTSETFARILTDFQNVGWLHRTRRWISITDPPSLDSLANGGRWRNP